MQPDLQVSLDTHCRFWSTQQFSIKGIVHTKTKNLSSFMQAHVKIMKANEDWNDQALK